MAISNFDVLLKNSLKGDPKALDQWIAHTRKKPHDFNAEQIQTALKAFKTASSSQDKSQKSASLFIQGLWHQFGIADKADYEKAKDFYNQAKELDNTYAMCYRAYMHKEALGGPQKFQDAIDLYDEAISKGNPIAMNSRALMHQKGQGGVVNYNEAARLYELAMKQNNPSAMNSRASLYEQGLGGIKNLNTAQKLYEKAAQLGNDTAKRNLKRLQNSPEKKEHYLEFIYTFFLKLYDKEWDFEKKLKENLDAEQKTLYENSLNAVKTVRGHIGGLYKAYKVGTIQDLDALKKQAKEIYEKKDVISALEILDTHRGQKQFIVDFFTAIFTLGISLIHGARTGNYSLFTVNTDTRNIINKESENIENLENLGEPENFFKKPT